MSSETILLPEGPEGPKKQLQQETSPLLSNSPDKQNSCTDESPDTMETSQTPLPGDHTADEQGHMTGVNHTHDDLVRIQPQPLPQPTTSLQHASNREAASQQNGLHARLNNGQSMPCRVTQPPTAEPRKQYPSPVSHRVQRKLRSSLSVNSDTSRRSKSALWVPINPAPFQRTAVSTASWPACSVNFSLCAIWWWLRPRAAPALQKPAAAAAQMTWETTATALVTWTVALWMPAVSRRTAWRSVWSVAESVSQHKSPFRLQPGQI